MDYKEKYEQEKIRKWIVRTLKSLNNSKIQIDGAYEMMLPAIAWLEKQGEKSVDKLQLSEELYEHIRNTCACIDDALSSETLADINDYLSMAERSAQSAFDMIEKQREKNTAGKVEPKFKVKYAGSEYNVFETKDIAGVTFYGIEDEPNHIDYVKAENCDIISGYAIKENGSPYPTKPAVFSEQKPADKVKPKFHEGDWVIGRATENEPRQIAEIKEEGYKTTYGGWIGFSFEEDMRLWTIEDAQSGDVLYTPKGCGIEGIFIVDDWKKVEDTGRTLCCNIGYRVEDDEIVAGGLGALWWKGVIDPFYPATKEQKELLFNKIRENGFEYDSKKKRYIRKKVPKEYAIIIDGVRHNLIKPEIEGCKKCSLDKFCDRFKEALCDSLVGRHTDMIFEKVE